MSKKIRKKLNNAKCRIKIYITIIALTAMSTPLIVHADLAGTWNVAMEVMFPFADKIGVLMIVFGGVEIAVAVQSEDAAQKTRAARFMIAGCTVIMLIRALKPYLLIS